MFNARQPEPFPSSRKAIKQNVSYRKGKGKQKQPLELPKSKEVRRLETLFRALQESSGTHKDPKGGCFCQGVGYVLVVVIFFDVI
jgi:hypothetical protein